MRIGNRRTVTHTTTETSEFCELCGATCPDGDGSWEHNAVTIEARIGDIYPEGDLREVYETEVCSKCFVAKVVPALEALGCKVRKRDAEDYKRVGGYYDRVDEAE